MKQFFKFLLASFIGVIAACFLFFLIVLVIASSGDKEISIKDKAVLSLDLSAVSMERSNKDPFAGINPFSTDLSEKPGLYEVIQAIKRAKDNPNIKGIKLNMSVFPMGIASAKEIRDELINFKESGKFVLCYSEILGQKAYYIASVADHLYINPKGNIELLGLSTETMFFTNALEKIGVEMQIIRHGQFKSAVEPFLRTDMSEPNKLQTSKFINSIWSSIKSDISTSRGLSLTDFDLVVDSAYSIKASGAKKYNLVDDLLYKDQVDTKLAELVGVEKESKVNYYSALNVVAASSEKYNKDKVALIFAHGNVVDGNAGEGSVGSVRIAKAIKEARENEAVKSIVIRINSPGGSALASEIIWREIQLTKGIKPIVASMGDLAASGGYYIACLADTIVCHPSTITGSIGVFGMFPNMQNLMEEKLGLAFDGVKTNNLSDFGSVNRPLKASERALLQGFVEDTYETFTQRVADGRNMSQYEVDLIGQGRVWAGSDAMEIGLVDTYGGFSKSIEIAAKMANLESYRVVQYPKLKDPIQQLLEDLSAQAKTQLFGDDPIKSEYIRYYENLSEVLEHQGIQCWMPYKYSWQ